MDGKGEETEGAVDEGSGDHEAGVESAADDATEGIPALRVEPVPELIKAVAGEEKGGAIVEIGVELVDHGLVAKNAEEADGECKDVDEGEGGGADQELLLLGLELDEGLEGRRRGEGRRGLGTVLGLGAHRSGGGGGARRGDLVRGFGGGRETL